jgi:hypothetical protein
MGRGLASILGVGAVVITTTACGSSSLTHPGGTAAVLVAGTKRTATQVAHTRNPTFKEREGITVALPKWLRRDPVGCVYLQVRVSGDGRFARVGVGLLNALHDPCVRYASNGPDWILRRNKPGWKVVAYTSGSAAPPRCSLGIPRYLLVRPCRR